jgi:proteic killer suppression protein
MIKSFGDKETQRLFEGGRTRKLPSEIQERALRRLVQIHRSVSLDDLRQPPSNHLEKLRGNLNEFHSIRINQQWRVIFVWTGADAENVSIVDYH